MRRLRHSARKGNKFLPRFSDILFLARHGTHAQTIERIPTWRSPHFPALSGVMISGDGLVKTASKRITEFIAATKLDLSKPLYWSYHHLLVGSEASGLEGPISLVWTSWINIWKEKPFPVLAVGSIRAQLIDNESRVKFTKQGQTYWPRPLTIFLGLPRDIASGKCVSRNFGSGTLSFRL